MSGPRVSLILVRILNSLVALDGRFWNVLIAETQLDGALAGMLGGNLPVVTGVTAYNHSELGPVLLGVGAAAWDDRAEQTEVIAKLP